MGAFDNARMVKINNKEVDSIKTNDGKTIYQRPVIATVTASNIRLGYLDYQWLVTNGNIIINWGDDSIDIVNNPTQELNHTYTDGKSEHNIVFLGTITSIGDYCFFGGWLKSITIPLSVVNFGNNCFFGTGLTSITIPSSVISLENGCFSNCTNLKTVIIPNNVTSIGAGCFYNSGLTNVSISNSVTSLGNNCFSGCTSLIDYELYWIGNNIITYDSDKMINNTNTKFYVPSGQKTNYVNKGYPSAKVVERSS